MRPKSRPAKSAAQSVPMSVPLLDLKQQYQPLAAEIMPILESICATQQFILGRHVVDFEQAAASYCRCAYTVGVSSGTDALLLALMALGVGAGDEVITTPFTFFATAGTIARSGARPVFCDIDPQTFNLSPTTVQTFLDTHCALRDGHWVNTHTGGRIKGL